MQYGKLLILNRCIACMSQEDQADLEYWEKRLKAAEPDILPENYLALRKHMKDIKEKKPRNENKSLDGWCGSQKKSPNLSLTYKNLTLKIISIL